MSKVYMDAEYIPVDLENFIDSNGMSNLQFNKDNFLAGMEIGSFYAGFATALFNAGLEEESVAAIVRDFLNDKGETE